MSSSDIGLKIGVEGDREFKKSLADINSAFKVLGSEMKLVASQFDKTDKSAGALASRNEVLNKAIEQQKQKSARWKMHLKTPLSRLGRMISVPKPGLCNSTTPKPN